MKFIERTLLEPLKKASETFPAVLISGPRQVGKSTLFEHAVSDGRVVISLDDPMVRSLAKNSPDLFFQTYPPPVLIDEIQYAPELFPYMKIFIDKSKKNGLFWLTGSQQFNMMQNVSESLAGRIAILNLQGLSQSEKSGDAMRACFNPGTLLPKADAGLSSKNVFEMIFRGSFPALSAAPKIDWALFYSSYLRTYIERDIRLLANISSEDSFLKFLRALAARTAQVLNYSNLARDVDVSVNTIKAWVSILQASGLIYLLRPFSKNVTARIVKSPKVYFLDTGLCAYLCGIESGEVLMNSAFSGAFFETYVISEILKSYWHNGIEERLFFYRDREQREIDLLIEKNQTVYPVEIKQTANPTESDCRHFHVLSALGVSVGAGAIICLSKIISPIKKDVFAVPVSSI